MEAQIDDSSPQVELWNNIWKPATIDELDLSKDFFYLILNAVDTCPPNMIEVGCGWGIRTIYLAVRCKLSPVLLDFSREALRKAKEISSKNMCSVHLIKGDALHLPIRGGSFDFVWSSGLNEHFHKENRQIIFDEMARICKAGKKMLVIVPNKWSIMYWIRRIVSEKKYQWRYGPEKPYSIIELRHRMRKAGINNLRIVNPKKFKILSYLFQVPILAVFGIKG